LINKKFRYWGKWIKDEGERMKEWKRRSWGRCEVEMQRYEAGKGERRRAKK
jgi:hypothetical protein